MSQKCFLAELPSPWKPKTLILILVKAYLPEQKAFKVLFFNLRDKVILDSITSRKTLSREEVQEIDNFFLFEEHPKSFTKVKIIDHIDLFSDPF